MQLDLKKVAFGLINAVSWILQFISAATDVSDKWREWKHTNTWCALMRYWDIRIYGFFALVFVSIICLGIYLVWIKDRQRSKSGPYPIAVTIIAISACLAISWMTVHGCRAVGNTMREWLSVLYVVAVATCVFNTLWFIFPSKATFVPTRRRL